MDEYRMIDSKDVSDFLSGFLTLMRKAVLYVVTALRRHIIAAILVFAAVMGAGVFLWQKSGKYYESEMVCEFNDLNKKIYGEMVQKLDDLARGQSYYALAANLHVPLNVAQAIVGIEGRNTSGSLLYEDFSPDRGSMYFKVIATNNSVFAPMQKALLDYLNAVSPYKLQTNQMETDRIRHKSDFLSKDILLVDSLISVYPTVLKSISSFDTAYKLSNFPTLLRYKGQLEEELLQQDWRSQELRSSSVVLLYGFAPGDHAGGGKNKMLVHSFFLACILSGFIAVLLKAFADDVKKEKG